MNGACLCGAVRIATDRRPDYVNFCDCTMCSKVGAVWGYLQAPQFTIEGKLESFVRSDIAEPSLAVNFCPTCGATTHWRPLINLENDIDGDRNGINMKLFDPADLIGVKAIFTDGPSHDDGTSNLRRPATVIEEGFVWYGYPVDIAQIGSHSRSMNAHTKLFKLNRSQAVRLPKSVAFPDGVEEVILRRDGRSVIITPAQDFWDEFFDKPGIDITEPQELPFQAREPF